ncbi:MAG: dethiobiotin synthase [Chitinophagaceae bacterium]
MEPIFVTGTGTDVGKTVASILIARSLGADYWKPVQAGTGEDTDSQLVQRMLRDTNSLVHPETYQLKLAASPHIAARQEGIKIDLQKILLQYNKQLGSNAQLIIEGAGGLLVPLNENEQVADLILKLKAKVVLVSRNYLGSINHSLLTAAVCRQRGLNVVGWVFNDEFMHYHEEIAHWSGYPVIATIPKLAEVTLEILQHQVLSLKNAFVKMLEP